MKRRIHNALFLIALYAVLLLSGCGVYWGVSASVEQVYTVPTNVYHCCSYYYYVPSRPHRHHHRHHHR
ncbi:MAG: hypothetical protein Q8R30_00830 [bacterium]|nr:hypothetical protein [bacterium]MDZ4285317.1 hypothetical protein [Candidatus Sungbacteria bacterium]